MQTFRFKKVTRYHEGTNEKSAYMVFIPHNHYQIVYLYFSVFQLASTNCFSILGSPLFDTVFKIHILSRRFFDFFDDLDDFL